MAEKLKFPCIMAQQGNSKVYVFKIAAKALFKIVQISKRDPEEDEGYQRAFSSSRVNQIANYVDDGNPIPLSVLVSFSHASYEARTKTLLIDKRKDAGWVIDGQHRLLGANAAKLDMDLVVVCFIKLGLEEQIQQFITINKTAKNVPTSLYLDLLKKLPPTKTRKMQNEERAADIATALSQEDESPFYQRIVIMTSPKKGELSLTNAVRKIVPHITQGTGLLANYTLNEQIKIFWNYYKAIENVFPVEFYSEKSVFFQTIGFGGLMQAFPLVFTKCLSQSKTFKVEDISKIFKKIEGFDFSSWKEGGTGSQAETTAGKDLMIEIEAAHMDESSTKLRL